jgi:hypothetical protein
VDSLEALHKRFEGDVTCALTVEHKDSETSAGLVFVVHADAGHEGLLEDFCKQLNEKIEERAEVTLHDLNVEGKLFRVSRPADEGEPSGSLPAMIGKHLAVFVTIGGDLQKWIGQCLRIEGDGYRLPAGEQPAVWLDLDTQGLLGLLTKALSEQLEDTIGFPLGDLFGSLGLNEVARLQLSAMARGEHLVVDTQMQFNGPRRGFMEAFVPDVKGAPKLYPWVPKQRPIWSAGPMRLASMYRAAVEVAELLGEQIPYTRAELEGLFTEFTGVRLKEDLIDHLGEEALHVQGKIELGVVDEDELGLSGYCFGLSLKNPQAFEQSIDKMIRQRGLHTGRKREDYRGCQVQHLKAFELYYAIAEDLLLVAIGDAGAKELRAVLDQMQAVRAGAGDDAPGKGVVERLPLVWQDWNAISISNLDVALDSIQQVWSQMPGPIAEQMRQVSEVVNKARGVVKSYRLEDMLQVSRSSGKVFESRLVW